MRGSFNTKKLIKRNLKFYRRQNIQLILAIALTTAIVCGAFLIGASVKNSLKNAMQNRLKQADYGIFQNERWFKSDLEKRFSAATALISVPAYMTAEDGHTFKINLYGIDKSFFKLAKPLPGTAYINQTTALMSGAKIDKSFALRCFKPSIMPGDTAWSNRDSGSIGLRLTVSKILSSADFGNFNPLNSQLAPANVFVDRDWLAKRLDKQGRANVLLSSTSEPISNFLTLADYGLSLKKLSNGEIELKSDRVFISPVIKEAANSLKYPKQAIFSYFANRINSKAGMTPYSFVAGIDSLSANESIINSWLADDLKLKAGDSFSMSYYIFDPMGELKEASAAFRVKSIISVKRDNDLMPKFPGMSDADSCSDWDPGIPINLKLIRAKDENYWDKYRGTPKVFIALKKAQKIWGCRFGNITALRFSNVNQKKLEESILSAISPAKLGFDWQNLKSVGKHGVANAVDFSGLFFGLSFFVIVAGIFLSGLLYQLHLEQRASEFAVLKSMGYGNNYLRRILMFEALFIMLIAIIIGIGAAFAYSYLIIYALNTVWNNIAGSIQISLSIDTSAILFGALTSIPLNVLVLFFALRKVLKSNLKERLVKSDFYASKIKTYLSIGIISLVFGTVIIVFGIKSGGTGVGAFFAAAALFLTGMICLSRVIIQVMPECFTGHGISMLSTALRNNSRNIQRSMAVIIIMALGLFLTLAVSFNRTDNQFSAGSRKSGTGGFGWYIETAIPVKGNLNSPAGRKRYRIKLTAKTKIVQLAMQDGGAAGCLNLNRVSRPQLLGLRPDVFDGRFIFQTPDVSWKDLQQNNSDIIPAIADQNVILWSIGLKIGDTLDYPGADGKVYKLKFIGGLDNSILQGSVLISKENLLRMFPDTSGSRILLIDQNNKDTGSAISRSMAKLGADIEKTASRLNRFGSIQNTYLMVFLSLGGIALIIGTLGLSIILRRNLLERRGEIAWLRSAGFSTKRIVFMLAIEHLILFDCAVFSGMIAAVSAGIPAMLSPSGNPPWLEMILLICLLWLFALIFIISTAHSASKGDIISGLHSNAE